MREHQSGWATVAFTVTFAGLGCLFGFFGLVPCLGFVLLLVWGLTVNAVFGAPADLLATPFPWSKLGSALTPVLLNSATAIASGYSAVLRLDGRPARRWAILSLVMASATVKIITTWWPHYYFIGM